MPNAYLTRRQFSGHLWAALVLPCLQHEPDFQSNVLERNAMQITLKRSGGFTGIPLTITIDTAKLSPDQASQLRHLVEAVDFHRPATNATPAQPDRFEYELTVQEGDRTHTITVQEAKLPEPLKPLLHWLMATAQQH